MSVLLPLAVDPSLLALAVVAGAVGALDDAGGAAGALLLAEGGRLRKGNLPEKDQCLMLKSPCKTGERNSLRNGYITIASAKTVPSLRKRERRRSLRRGRGR